MCAACMGSFDLTILDLIICDLIVPEPLKKSCYVST